MRGRLTKTGLETRIRDIGKNSGDIKAHPHKFRRTFATNMLKKDVPLERIKVMLGHENMDTTLLYAMVDTDSVKYTHSKFVD